MLNNYVILNYKNIVHALHMIFFSCFTFASQPHSLPSLQTYLSLWCGCALIIELVDSNVAGAQPECRDSADTQYMEIQINLKISKTASHTSLYNNVPFIFECFHDQQDSQWRKKASQSTKPRTHKTGQMFFFLLSFFLSSDGVAQYCMNLSRWFTHETAAFCREQCTTPSLFHNFEVSLVTTHSKTMASSLGHHFHSYLYACALKDHLAMNQNHYSKLLN